MGSLDCYVCFEGASVLVSALRGYLHPLELWASLVGLSSPVTAERGTRMEQPDLHEVILEVLRDAGRCMTVPEIHDEIATRDLWRRPSDHRHPPVNQISARVSNHKELFVRRDGSVCLARP